MIEKVAFGAVAPIPPLMDEIIAKLRILYTQFAGS